MQFLKGSFKNRKGGGYFFYATPSPPYAEAKYAFNYGGSWQLPVPFFHVEDSCCLTEAAPPIIRISDQSSRKFCDSSDTRSTLSLWKGFFRGCLEGEATRHPWVALNTRDVPAVLSQHHPLLKLAGVPCPQPATHHSSSRSSSRL